MNVSNADPGRAKVGAGHEATSVEAPHLLGAEWGRDAGDHLVRLATATVHWPLAFDWVDANRDPRLHLRRLSITLAKGPARLPSDAVRRLGSLLAAIRNGTSRSLVDAAAEVGIDPVALSLLEHGLLRDEEVTTVLLERLAWGFYTTEAHLASVLRGADTGTTETSPPSREGVDLGMLLTVLSLDEASPAVAYSMLGVGPRPELQRRGSSDERSVLDHALACPPVVIGDDGAMAAPTLRPDARHRAGYATIVVHVRDHAAKPVSDREVRLALSDPLDLPGADPSSVTNEAGVATIPNVWLPDLMLRVGDDLRLPLVG